MPPRGRTPPLRRRAPRRWGRRRRLARQLPRQNTRVPRPRPAPARPLGMRPRGHPRGRTTQARHDPRRPFQDQRGHRPRPRVKLRQTLPGRHPQRDIQPRQLHGPDRGGSAQSRGGVRPEEAHGGHAPRRDASEDVRVGRQGVGP